jgi:hypothetical protein
VEKLTYFDNISCYRLANAVVELVVTTGVGPRIIRYGFRGEENILGEIPDVSIETELGPWKPWGGHRLWTAPEANPRSYVPDNSPVPYEIEDEKTIRLVQAVEPHTGIEKEMRVALAEDDDSAGVTIHHRLTNRNLWAIEVAPWAITTMRGGGCAILPQEPYRSWDEYLLPARPLVLWHYTDLSDPRWTIGGKYIRLRTDASIAAPQKIGIANKQGWAAYHLGKTLFVKRAVYQEGMTYPDYGSSTETYTAASNIEVETLAPLSRLEPGASALHVERWQLFKDVEIGTSEATIEEAITPLLAQTRMSG